jgi:hypothetical protein
MGVEQQDRIVNSGNESITSRLDKKWSGETYPNMKSRWEQIRQTYINHPNEQIKGPAAKIDGQMQLMRDLEDIMKKFGNEKKDKDGKIPPEKEKDYYEESTQRIEKYIKDFGFSAEEQRLTEDILRDFSYMNRPNEKKKWDVLEAKMLTVLEQLDKNIKEIERIGKSANADIKKTLTPNNEQTNPTQNRVAEYGKKLKGVEINKTLSLSEIQEKDIKVTTTPIVKEAQANTILKASNILSIGELQWYEKGKAPRDLQSGEVKESNLKGWILKDGVVIGLQTKDNKTAYLRTRPGTKNIQVKLTGEQATAVKELTKYPKEVTRLQGELSKRVLATEDQTKYMMNFAVNTTKGQEALVARAIPRVIGTTETQIVDSKGQVVKNAPTEKVQEGSGKMPYPIELSHSITKGMKQGITKSFIEIASGENTELQLFKNLMDDVMDNRDPLFAMELKPLNATDNRMYKLVYQHKGESESYRVSPLFFNDKGELLIADKDNVNDGRPISELPGKREGRWKALEAKYKLPQNPTLKEGVTLTENEKKAIPEAIRKTLTGYQAETAKDYLKIIEAKGEKDKQPLTWEVSKVEEKDKTKTLTITVKKAEGDDKDPRTFSVLLTAQVETKKEEVKSEEPKKDDKKQEDKKETVKKEGDAEETKKKSTVDTTPVTV